MNRRGFEFSFGWIFAIIVGAVIIVLAVYAAVKLVGTERSIQNTESAKELGIILTPVQTGFNEEKSVAPITFATETRVYNNCTLRGAFGEQLIAVAASSSLGTKWAEPGTAVKFYDKYIFSDRVVQGKNINVLPRSFDMPFKVADMLVLWAGSYCFVNAPNEIVEDVEGLALRGINLSSSINDCASGSRKVCFYSDLDGCDIFVDPIQNSVRRNATTVFFEGELIYGAIFAEPDIYECQLKRLMRRTAQISTIYSAKSDVVSAKSSSGCTGGMSVELSDYAKMALDVNKSAEINEIVFSSNQLKSENDRMTCGKLWGEQ